MTVMTSTTPADIDRLNEACIKAPGAIEPQIALWQGVAALETWFCINRGTDEAPRPYALAADAGSTLCVYSSPERARDAAYANGLIAEGEKVPMLGVPMPAGLDWALSLGVHGITGVVIDYPMVAAWTPLPNLERLRAQGAS